jgi:FkbM family methyltransferase
MPQFIIGQDLSQNMAHYDGRTAQSSHSVARSSMKSGYHTLFPRSARSWVRQLPFLNPLFMLANPRESRERELEKLLEENRPTAAVKLPFGKIFLDVRDIGIGKPLFLDHKYEPAETAFMERFIRPGMVILDIGANIGYFTALATSRLRKSGVIHAFEPDPHNYSLLEKTVADQNTNLVHLHHCALGDENGTVELFHSPVDNFGDHRVYGSHSEDHPKVAVPMKIGDDLLASIGTTAIDFIKIDVQGFEVQVLRGLTNTIKSSEKVVLLSEVWPSGMTAAGSSVEEFASLCQSLGFAPHALLQTGQTRKIEWNEVLQFAGSVEKYCSEEGYFNIIGTK